MLYTYCRHFSPHLPTNACQKAWEAREPHPRGPPQSPVLEAGLLQRPASASQTASQKSFLPSSTYTAQKLGRSTGYCRYHCTTLPKESPWMRVVTCCRGLASARARIEVDDSEKPEMPLSQLDDLNPGPGSQALLRQAGAPRLARCSIPASASENRLQHNVHLRGHHGEVSSQNYRHRLDKT